MDLKENQQRTALHKYRMDAIPKCVYGTVYNKYGNKFYSEIIIRFIYCKINYNNNEGNK